MNLDLWRDIAGILLILELIILVLPVLVLSFFAVRTAGKLNRTVANFFIKAHIYAGKTQHAVDRSAEIAASPVITLYALAAFAKGAARGMNNVVRGKSG